MSEGALWLCGLAAFPLTVLGAYVLRVRGGRLYRLAAACACLLAVFAAAPLAFDFLGAAPAVGLWPFSPLAVVLIPFAAFLWLITVVVTPSGRRDEAGLARSAAACLLHMAAFLTASAPVLVAVWAATSWLFLSANAEVRFRAARKLAAAYLGASIVLLIAGVLLVGWARGKEPVLEQCGLALVLIAVMIRKGIFPFHAWIPESFEHGRIGPATRFNAPQIGTYTALVLAFPSASPLLIRLLAVLALATAVYASVLALYQSDARRACGYLFVSQSALVIAGLGLRDPGAVVGALLLWVCSGVALAGLSRAVLALEARRGRLRLDVYHGGYGMMPQLAVCFLVMGLAVADFPGTLGFVGGEMLVRGAVDTFLALGLFAVIATAFNGLAAVRMFFSLFCGKKASGAHLSLGRAEALGFAAAALILVGFGLAPGRLARLLSRAAPGFAVRQ